MSEMTRKALRPGQRIRIPWGLDEVDAVITGVVERDDTRHILLVIELKGDPGVPDETLEWQFPEESLLAAAG